MNTNLSISVKNLSKSYGTQLVLHNISFEVPKGTVFALLGPNGAGKTTAVRIMTTLLKADAGEVLINGIDVAKHPDQVQGMIGLTGQNAAVDEKLTGLANLEMMGRLYHLSATEASLRAKDLIEQFELADAAKRPVKTYSGGMRRRLDLAASLIVSPPLLFLDEPTTGLDPHSRNNMWAIIKGLVAQGTTLLLTTQYLEEADQLADTIAVINHGDIIAQGTAKELKQSLGGERLEVTFTKKADVTAVQKLLRDWQPHVKADSLTVVIEITKGFGQLAEVIDRLKSSAVPIAHTALHEPTLDDVFLTLTGHEAEVTE